MKLAELVTLSNKIEEMLIDSGGELTELIEEALSLRDKALPDKIESYAHVVERSRHLAQFYAKKANELIKISEGCEKLADKLVDNVDISMQQMGVNEITGHDHKFKRVGCDKRLIIDPNADIPSEYLTVIPERTEPNKQAIKKALKDGEAIPGCRLDGGSYIKIGINK